MVWLNSFSNYFDFILAKYEEHLHDKSITASHSDVAFMNSAKRVISCFVNEMLVLSSLIKTTKHFSKCEEKNVFWIVLHTKKDPNYKVWAPISTAITDKNINFDLKDGRVRSLDPNDIGQVIYFSEIRNNQSIHCELLTETKQLFAMLLDLDDAQSKCKISEVINEINNSIRHQILAYKENKPFIPLYRPPIEYEQAIVEGHHTHPMNKSRVPMPQMTVNTELYNFERIKIYFYKLPKSCLNIYGNYEKII